MQPPSLAAYLAEHGSLAGVADRTLDGLRNALVMRLASESEGVAGWEGAYEFAFRCRTAVRRAVAGWDGPEPGPGAEDVVKMWWIADLIESDELADTLGPLIASAFDDGA